MIAAMEMQTFLAAKPKHTSIGGRVRTRKLSVVGIMFLMLVHAYYFVILKTVRQLLISSFSSLNMKLCGPSYQRCRLQSHDLDLSQT